MNASEQIFLHHVSEIEPLIEHIRQHPDADFRRKVQRLTQMLLELHQQGLTRILQQLQNDGQEGAALDRLLQDPLVANLLVLHGLHPADFQTRLQQGIANVEKLIASHGATMLVESGTEESVTITIAPADSACASSSDGLCHHVRQLIMAAVPDAIEVAVRLSTSNAADDTSLLPIIER